MLVDLYQQGRLDLDAFVTEQFHHRVPGDPLQDPCRHGRRVHHSPADDEQVHPTALRDGPGVVEHDRLVIAGGQSFLFRQDRVEVPARPLGGRDQ